MRNYGLHILFLGLFLSVAPAILAQEEGTVLSKNFSFKDGVYQSFEEFQANDPTYDWEEVQATVFSNPQNFMAQVQYIKKGTDTEAEDLNLEDIWGISLGGIPYIRLPKGTVDKSLTVFAGLRLRGKICYFNFENEVNRKVEMPVYNPVNKYVYRTVWIDRVVSVTYEKLLHFETGEVVDFTPATFRQWIADDPRLVETLDDMSPSELKEKLFKCLLIYVDRNQVEISNKSKTE